MVTQGRGLTVRATRTRSDRKYSTTVVTVGNGVQKDYLCGRFQQALPRHLLPPTIYFL